MVYIFLPPTYQFLIDLLHSPAAALQQGFGEYTDIGGDSYKCKGLYCVIMNKRGNKQRRTTLLRCLTEYLLHGVDLLDQLVD